MGMIPKTREEQRYRRHLRVRKKVAGTAERPRLVIFRSLKHITAQLVDDVSRHTLLTVSSSDLESGNKTAKSLEVGKRIASRAKDAGITEKTLRNAREKMNVETKRDGFQGACEWRLPDGAGLGV